MGFLSDILGAVAPAAVSAIPGIGPIAGPILGAATQGVLGSIGNDRAAGQEQAAAQQALQASRPVSVFGPTGSSVYNAGNNSITQSLNPFYANQSQRALELGARGLQQFRNFRPEGFNVQRETNRLRQLRAPDIRQARSQLQSQLLNRGRLGVGVGGGRGGRLFNPETAGLEEAILGSQLSDITQAQQMGLLREEAGFNRQDQLLNQAQGLFGVAGGLAGGGEGAAQLGIQARTPQSIAALQAQPGNNQAASTRGFFSSLGVNLGGSLGQVAEGFFGDSHWPSAESHPTDYRNDIYT